MKDNNDVSSDAACSVLTCTQERNCISKEPSDGDTSATAVGVITDSFPSCEMQGFSGDLKSAKVSSKGFSEKIEEALEYDIAENTKKNYLGQWRLFSAWALNRGVSALPADPEIVAEYLSERFEDHMNRPGTLSTVAAAIAFFHREAGLESPRGSLPVRRILRKATRSAGRFQRQAEALTEELLMEIQETACIPRRSRGGNTESAQTARIRGRKDIAMVRLMRDAMLRVSEAAELHWEDLASLSDGTGRLFIRRSKTDSTGKGAIAFVSPQTMGVLKLLRATRRTQRAFLDWGLTRYLSASRKRRWRLVLERGLPATRPGLEWHATWRELGQNFQA